MQEQLTAMVHRPTGALLVTGPTGSGKSTTLFAALTEINRPEINVITVEDPVEYRLAGLNQVQINPRAGLTFATALRSILRSDPDVVMVGEIRDVETAKISIEAALTGPLRPLDAAHERRPGRADAPERDGRRAVPDRRGGHRRPRAAPRAPALRALQGALHADQGGARRGAHPRRAPARQDVELFRRNGCVRCRQTGYSGRIGVFQLLEMNEELSTLAARKASHEELERAAMDGGMTTLWDDGIEKVVAGLTSLEELARVTTL